MVIGGEVFFSKEVLDLLEAIPGIYDLAEEMGFSHILVVDIMKHVTMDTGFLCMQVNDVNFENMSNDDAVRILQDIVSKPGPISLTVAKCWDPSPRSCCTIPRAVPVRPIDTASRISHTTAPTGAYPHYDNHASVTLYNPAELSAINTIIPAQLHSKLTQLNVPASTCQWITNFLTGREQQMRLGKIISGTKKTSTGAPQAKTVEMDVESHRFLGTTVTKDLKWDCNISSIIKKDQQRMCFLHQLRKFNLSLDLIVQFYTSTIESVITSSITVWSSSATKHDTHRLQRIIRMSFYRLVQLSTERVYLLPNGDLFIDRRPVFVPPDPAVLNYITAPALMNNTILNGAEPVRPIDPASWISHTTALTGTYPHYECEDLSLSTNKTDMSTIVKVMQLPDSGLEMRDRMWLKSTTANVVIGEAGRLSPSGGSHILTQATQTLPQASLLDTQTPATVSTAAVLAASKVKAAEVVAPTPVQGKDEGPPLVRRTTSRHAIRVGHLGRASRPAISHHSHTRSYPSQGCSSHAQSHPTAWPNAVASFSFSHSPSVQPAHVSYMHNERCTPLPIDSQAFSLCTAWLAVRSSWNTPCTRLRDCSSRTHSAFIPATQIA
ncbi:hypothetical protein NFI96_020122 [Prochilodus magdalenae]|nr:hypothetical protein NFI96_020122 [Prochilodus magdalenae]